VTAPSVSEAPLDPRRRREVLDLARRVAEEDGAPPLSDQTLGRIGAPDGVDLTATAGDELAGYARLDGDTVEAVGIPEAIAPLLAAAVRAAAGPVHVWSHGRRSRLAEPLRAAGFATVRELHQLRRPLNAAELPPDPPLPEGVAVRAFRPGDDDSAWLALNAAAFAHHPEQGRWTIDDLRAREGEDWFDPAGFLLAARGADLLGFHWTKVHPDGLGEVYVLGVDPGTQGTGLGRALLVRGLRHLADRGCPQVLLYVDGDNTSARRLYEREGFAPYDLDSQWQKRVDEGDEQGGT
jgi:mycothiol synthase